MKPQHAKPHFMNEAYEVVAPSCMRQLVDKDRAQLMLTQQSVNPVRKQYMRTKNPVYCWSLPTPREPYRDALRKETRPRVRGTSPRGPDLSIALVRPYPQPQPRKHQGCAEQPHCAK